MDRVSLVGLFFVSKSEDKHFEYLIGIEDSEFHFHEGFAAKHQCNPTVV